MPTLPAMAAPTAAPTVAPGRLNVLVYDGPGAGVESVRQCLGSLRRLLSPRYTVAPVAAAALLREPWPASCALLVVPGGADLAYCRVLDGAGNRRIADYVRRGGAYLGLCAGAYYGSARCEFELGRPGLEVVGSRELALFPGTCRGAAFAGFEYQGERAARVALLAVAADACARSATATPGLPARFACYCNSGGVFLGVPRPDVDILASYLDPLDVDAGDDKAAVVLCRVGDGKALLCGPHPEFAATGLHPQPSVPGYDELVERLAADDEARVAFLRACLASLGLDASPHDEAPAPRLSTLHLSAADGAGVADLLGAWDDVLDREGPVELIRGEADTFRVRGRDGLLALDDLRRALPGPAAVGHVIVAHRGAPPAAHLTPRFDHALYYDSLRRFHAVDEGAADWGSLLLYGDVVSSTNSLLDQNPRLTSRLPSGFTLAASTQVAARGRGTNAWIAPPGALMFSVVVNHPAHLAASRPVIFLQYAAAIAVVEAIKSLGPGYEELPVKLKWPNDIYALDPSKPAQYVKIGGLLSQCGYCDGSYQIVLGIGINATNPRPTTSLADLLPAHAAPLRLEVLLARVLARLEAVYAQFRRRGFAGDLERRYYRHWLHTGQYVSLEAEAGARGRVVGITADWGMLRVEETDPEGRGTGRMWILQSDENSFDFWQGLVRRKEQ